MAVTPVVARSRGPSVRWEFLDRGGDLADATQAFRIHATHSRPVDHRPAVLLLDEPLGALDLKLRKAMQLDVRYFQLQVGITFIYVTHDQEEARTMSDRIAVMQSGKILQVGRPMEIYEDPGTRFVADFVGETNFVDGRVVTPDDSQAEVDLEGTIVRARISQSGPHAGQEVTLGVHPDKLRLTPLDGRPRSTLHGTVGEVVYTDTDTRHVIELPNGLSVVSRVQIAGGTQPGGFARGTRVQIAWETEAARVLSGAETQRRTPDG